MKFLIPSKVLYSLTSSVSKVINSKNALLILNSFRFILDGNTLSITGSDVENALTARPMVAEPEGSGSFCLDARTLVDLLKQFPDNVLKFEVSEDSPEVVITHPNGKYEMPSQPGDQYPEYRVDEAETDESFRMEIKAADLQQGLDNTIFAVATEDFRPQMTGVLLDITPEQMTFVATDTRKLVRFTNSKIKGSATGKYILPVKPASIIKSLFGADDTVIVTLCSKFAVFESETFTFHCRFIQGMYPDYNRVIPRDNPYTVRVDRMRFLNSVRRVGVFVDPGFGLEKFKLADDVITIKSCDPNMSRLGEEKIDCEYSGPEMVIGFSAPFLVEICNVINSQDLVICLSDPSRPGVFMPSSNDDGTDLVAILMPMNVRDF